jgi:thiol-disulfide isomerase/thioredoxin
MNTQAPRPGRWINRLYSLLTAGLVMFLAWRLGPHLAAMVGIDMGSGTRPRYALAALDGAPLTNETLHGKVVLVNAWATWCPPCRAEMPMLQQMYDRHRDKGLVIVGLSADTIPPSAVQAWLAQRALTFPVAIGTARDFQAFGGVGAFPTSFLLDRQGRVRHKVVGPIGALSLELAVRRLLDETAG